MTIPPEAVTARCDRVSGNGYGCWLVAGHDGDCEPDGSKLGAVVTGGPRCQHCGAPLIRWPSGTWADTGGMVACEVTPGSKRFRGHEPSRSETEPEVQAAIAAAARAIQRQHDPEAWNQGHEPTAFDMAEGRAAIAAAASYLAGPAYRDGYESGRAAGAAAERDRIRHLAEQENAHYGCSRPEDYGEPFAGLLGEP